MLKLNIFSNLFSLFINMIPLLTLIYLYKRKNSKETLLAVINACIYFMIDCLNFMEKISTSTKCQFYFQTSLLRTEFLNEVSLTRKKTALNAGCLMVLVQYIIKIIFESQELCTSNILNKMQQKKCVCTSLYQS